MDKTAIGRVRSELKAVGVGPVGLKTPEAKELCRILHPDEHIGGVVYGRYSDGLAWLIATDRRIIFMDKKPFYATTDELTYDVVSGVRRTRSGLFAAVTLHTRVSDYNIRFVTNKCAGIFVKYIENKRVETAEDDGADEVASRPRQESVDPPIFQKDSSKGGIEFLRTHDLAVLSTIDRTGNVHGAVVYYLVDQHDLVYVLTKSGSEKGRDVYSHSQIALTVHEVGTMQTLQLQGVAEVETDQATKDKVFSQIVEQKPYRDEAHMPPVTKLHEGSFMVIRITPTYLSFHDYAKIE